MSKIIAVHSYKGGTGKTLLSVNLAATFAKLGKKVCVFDLDFRAPSLFAILKAEGTQYWFNDYLNNTADIGKVLIDLSSRVTGKGKLYASLANPATEAIRDMSSKDRKWEMRALGRLLALKETLLANQKFDYLFFDTISRITILVDKRDCRRGLRNRRHNRRPLRCRRNQTHAIRTLQPLREKNGVSPQ